MQQDGPLTKLLVRDDEGQVSTLSLADPAANEITLGRDFDCTVHLPDITVSRCHARLTRSTDGRSYVLEDLDSYNGVLLNGDRITGPTKVSIGDRIIISGFMIWFERSDGRGAFDCPTVRIESPKR